MKYQFSGRKQERNVNTVCTALCQFSIAVELLNSLLKFEQPLSEILPLLNSFEWDSEKALILLNKRHIVEIIQRYLDGKLSSSEVEDWANAIEGREDIEYERDCEQMIDDAIYELANPLLTRSLSADSAREWLEKFAKMPTV